MRVVVVIAKNLTLSTKILKLHLILVHYARSLSYSEISVVEQAAEDHLPLISSLMRQVG